MKTWSPSARPATSWGVEHEENPAAPSTSQSVVEAVSLVTKAKSAPVSLVGLGGFASILTAGGRRHASRYVRSVGFFLIELNPSSRACRQKEAVSSAYSTCQTGFPTFTKGASCSQTPSRKHRSSTRSAEVARRLACFQIDESAAPSLRRAAVARPQLGRRPGTRLARSDRMGRSGAPKHPPGPPGSSHCDRLAYPSV
jgi:hypothetical protein